MFGPFRQWRIWTRSRQPRRSRALLYATRPPPVGHHDVRRQSVERPHHGRLGHRPIHDPGDADGPTRSCSSSCGADAMFELHGERVDAPAGRLCSPTVATTRIRGGGGGRRSGCRRHARSSSSLALGTGARSPDVRQTSAICRESQRTARRRRQPAVWVVSTGLLESRTGQSTEALVDLPRAHRTSGSFRETQRMRRPDRRRAEFRNPER